MCSCVGFSFGFLKVKRAAVMVARFLIKEGIVETIPVCVP